MAREQHANPFLDIKEEFDRFSNRIDTFMSLSDAVVVAPGGIGTLLEFFYSWQLTQVEQLCETPIILYGEIWTNLLGWLEKEVMPKKLFDKGDMHNIFHVIEPVNVVDLIVKIHKDRLHTEHVCRNFNQYRVEISDRERF
jgi:predicted Rossmann-fold nucleotide-binding protein